MSASEIVSSALLISGALFFLGGTLGLLRFPDALTRLHALSKADNVGLGFVVVGLSITADSAAEIAKLAMIWGLVLFSSAVTAQLIARTAYRENAGGL